MAPHGESISTSYSRKSPGGQVLSKPPRLSSESLKRTVSDISFELSKVADEETGQLDPISEVEEAKCECCGMAEECTPEYIERVREKYLGKMVCGLCAEAVKEEIQRKGDGGPATKAAAIESHTATCMKFNKYGRAYPVLFSAEAMREMLKKSKVDGNRIRAKSISPRDVNNKKIGGIARSSSCIPAITRDISDLNLASTTPNK